MKKYKFSHTGEVKEVVEVQAESAMQAWQKFMATVTYRLCPIARKTGGGFSFWLLKEL